MNQGINDHIVQDILSNCTKILKNACCIGRVKEQLQNKVQTI